MVLRADLDRLLHAAAPRRTQLSLLASLDPYTMGFRRRARMLDAERRAFAYDRGGNATSVVLVDGRVAGVWDVLDHHSEARFFPFVNPTPRMPDSLEQLDGLLITIPKHRTVQRDGIHFHGQRYLSPILAPFVGPPTRRHVGH